MQSYLMFKFNTGITNFYGYLGKIFFSESKKNLQAFDIIDMYLTESDEGTGVRGGEFTETEGKHADGSRGRTPE